METPSTPSLAGPARRTRRGAAATPAGPTTNFGRPGSAINAADSPYARRAPATVASSRPELRRDASSNTLAKVEGGRDADTPAPAASKKDRRRSLMGAVGAADTPSLLGRVVRKSLGWLVGRPIPNLDDDAQGESRGDEETGQAHQASSTRSDTKSARPASLAFPPPLTKRTYAASPSVASSSLALNQYHADDNEEIVSPKRIRSSHSTLNLPTTASVPSSLARASAGPSYATSRHRSPVRNTSPSRPNGFGSGLSRSKTSIFSGRPPPLALSANLPASASIRSASPGADSQTAMAAPASASSSTFGLQSQSPFRIGRSPELPVDALNISSGLARSPSVPLERLAIQQQQARLGDRLYPYQRSPSVASQSGRPANIPFSFSMANGLSGSKRSHAAMSASPPKISPARSNFSFSRYNIPSPSSTDFAGSDGYHRAKRQKTSVVWDPAKGFVAGDEHGNPIKEEPTQSAPPKNEAERILERLESIRRPQLDTLRNKSPKRINVPLPAISTPSNDSIFATQITASRSVPALTSHAISPYARRQLAVEEQTTSQRDKLRSEGGIGELMRLAVVARENRRKRMEADEDEIDRLMSSTEGQDGTKRRDDRSGQEEDEQDGETEEHLADLPQPPRRRTRQRTRELSVMSDASDMQEDSQAFSPRRSTRHKGKARAQESETEEVQPSSKRRPGQTRAPKSAKAPEPVQTTKKAKKATKSGKETRVREDDSATESEQEESADEGVKTRSGRRLRSPGPASPPPAMAGRKKKEKRPISPVAGKAANRRELSASIDQVMALESGKSKTAQSRSQSSQPKDPEGTFSRPASRRKLMSFAASDNEEDKDEQVPPTEEPALVDHDGQGSRPERLEMAKLKLPNSIFTNRFSFGKTPQSPVLAARSRSASVLDEQDLPPAVTVDADTGATPKGNANGEVAQPANKPMFAFKAPALDAPALAPQNSMPPPASTMPSFSLKPTSQATASETAASVKPASPFSFAPPVNPSPPSVAGTTAPASSDTSKSNGPAPSASPASAFTFASKPAEVQTVDAASQPPNSTAEKPKSTPFSFGMPKTTTEPAATSGPSAITTNPFAAFPTATSTAPTDAQPKAPTFSFNAGTQNSAGADNPVSTPSFTFGKPASASNEATQPASKPSFSGFSFKPAPSTGVSDTPAKIPATTDASATNGAFASPEAMQQSPPTTRKPAVTNAGPFSPVIAPAAKGFSFGSSTVTSPAPVEVSKPAFSFGAAQPTPSVTPSAAPAAVPTFSFGVSSPVPTAAPAFNFGNNASSGQPSSSAGTSTAFGGSATGAVSGNPFGAAATPAFGASSSQTSSQTSAPKPAFTFGSATPSPSSNTAFNFGNSASAATTTPAFTFGGAATQPAQQNQPAFSFGASGTTAPSTPSFSFGAATPSAGGFTFNAAPTPNFGAPATPGGTGIPGASLFNAGIVGDEPTSPNKGRRPIKGLRGARKP